MAATRLRRLLVESPTSHQARHVTVLNLYEPGESNDDRIHR